MANATNMYMYMYVNPLKDTLLFFLQEPKKQNIHTDRQTRAFFLSSLVAVVSIAVFVAVEAEAEADERSRRADERSGCICISAMDVVTSSNIGDRPVEKVVVHPLVLLSIVDNYNRVAKETRKRVVGVLLGSTFRGRVDVTNSYAGQHHFLLLFLSHSLSLCIL